MESSPHNKTWMSAMFKPIYSKKALKTSICRTTSPVFHTKIRNVFMIDIMRGSRKLFGGGGSEAYFCYFSNVIQRKLNFIGRGGVSGPSTPSRSAHGYLLHFHLCSAVCCFLVNLDVLNDKNGLLFFLIKKLSNSFRKYMSNFSTRGLCNGLKISQKHW